MPPARTQRHQKFFARFFSKKRCFLTVLLVQFPNELFRLLPPQAQRVAGGLLGKAGAGHGGEDFELRGGAEGAGAAAAQVGAGGGKFPVRVVGEEVLGGGGGHTFGGEVGQRVAAGFAFAAQALFAAGGEGGIVEEAVGFEAGDDGGDDAFGGGEGGLRRFGVEVLGRDQAGPAVQFTGQHARRAGFGGGVAGQVAKPGLV